MPRKSPSSSTKFRLEAVQLPLPEPPDEITDPKLRQLWSNLIGHFHIPDLNEIILHRITQAVGIYAQYSRELDRLATAPNSGAANQAGLAARRSLSLYLSHLGAVGISTKHIVETLRERGRASVALRPPAGTDPNATGADHSLLATLPEGQSAPRTPRGH